MKILPAYNSDHCRWRCSRGLQTGFTLIELMITLTIASILLVIGVPAFQTYIANQRLKTASFDLFSTLIFARSEAIKRGTNVNICQSSNGATCNGTTWSDGWIIYADTPANIIKVFGPLQGDFTITSSASTITYLKNGRLPTSVSSGVTIKLGSPVTGTQERCVGIDLSGRPSTDKPDSSGNCRA